MTPLEFVYLVLGIVALALLIYIRFAKHLKDKQM